jgi:hypothetical protein
MDSVLFELILMHNWLRAETCAAAVLLSECNYNPEASRRLGGYNVKVVRLTLPCSVALLFVKSHVTSRFCFSVTHHATSPDTRIDAEPRIGKSF